MCALFVLWLPTSAAAGSLQPDPPTTPAPVGLRPDAFPSTATPEPRQEAAAPVTRVTPVTHVVPVTGGAVAPSLATPAVEKPPPIVAAPVSTRVVPAATHVVLQQTRTKTHRAATTHRAVPRVRLPPIVGATSTMRIGLLGPARAVPALAAVPGRRDVLPAALALLALVVTSGCFLAVAVRHRQQELLP